MLCVTISRTAWLAPAQLPSSPLCICLAATATTDVGWYAETDGMEVHPDRPELLPTGLEPYPGGFFLQLELDSLRVSEVGGGDVAADACGRRLEGEGVLAYNVDVHPQRAPRGFALTWPSGRFKSVDLRSGAVKCHGAVSGGGGEGVHPRTGDYRTVCRAIGVDPRDGSAYFTDAEGHIMRYDPRSDAVTCLRSPHLRLDYFGSYDPSSAGSMGYNWRQIQWVEELQAFAGVHGNSGYLFLFRPPTGGPGGGGRGSIELLERITSDPSRACGMYDQFSYGYLGFALGPDGHTLYYLTGAPIFRDGRRVEGEKWIPRGAARGDENLHLVTYDLRTSERKDHGPILYAGKEGSCAGGVAPSYVNSIAVDADGAVYSMGRMTDEAGHTRTDLWRISASQIRL